MNVKEALTRVKTGNFNGGCGFYAVLVDAVGIISEMLKSGQLSEVVRCKDCRWYDEKISFCDNCHLPREQTFFCADGKCKEGR